MVPENWQVRVEMLRHLARSFADGEGAPSVRELGRAVGLKSSQSAYKHLRRLEESGYVERRAGESRRLARDIRLTERGWEAAGEMPLMGRIAAGRGLEAVGAGDEAYSLAQELLGSGEGRYLLRVIGQSMIGAHIADGDLLVVEPDEDPPDGTVVAALIGNGDEVTVKRLFREGEKVRLRPENGDHEDIVLGGEEVEVQGRVVYVIHPPRSR